MQTAGEEVDEEVDMGAPIEDGLHVEHDGAAEPEPAEVDTAVEHDTLDADFDLLRDAFVEGFNDRDLDAVLGIVHPDVECPDVLSGDGPEALAEELQAIWERSPAAILTRALLSGTPCAVGWLPDEGGAWARAALVCFDASDGLITLVEMPDDPVSLEEAEAIEPTGEELDEWNDWAGWEHGEETSGRARTSE